MTERRTPVAPADAASDAGDPFLDGPPLQRLLAIMARLRDPQRGCPWDVQRLRFG